MTKFSQTKGACENGVPKVTTKLMIN